MSYEYVRNRPVCHLFLVCHLVFGFVTCFWFDFNGSGKCRKTHPFRDGPVLMKAELYQHFSFVNNTVTPVGPCPLDAADIVTFSYSVDKTEAKPICDSICFNSLPRMVNGNSLSRKSSMPLGLLTRGCPSSGPIPGRLILHT